MMRGARQPPLSTSSMRTKGYKYSGSFYFQHSVFSDMLFCFSFHRQRQQQPAVLPPCISLLRVASQPEWEMWKSRETMCL